MMYFTHDHYERDLNPPPARGEAMDERCGWCQRYFDEHESAAPHPRVYCSNACEADSTDAERIR